MQPSSVRSGSVRQSVCPTRPPHAAAACLLLWARRAGDISRLLHDRRSAAAAPQQRMRVAPLVFETNVLRTLRHTIIN